MLDQVQKALRQVNEQNKEYGEFKYLDPKEKIEKIKKNFNLTHGKGKRKKKK